VLGDASLRRRRAEAGRQTALRYDWPVMADHILRIYADILGDQESGRLSA
jgi:hypothetical protein